jgi:predicted  nucleic acid-binding Zn-ribbon protein
MTPELIAILSVGVAGFLLMLTLFTRLERRIDRLETRMEDRMDRMETRLQALEQGQAELKGLGDRIDRIEARMDDRMDRIETRLQALEQGQAELKGSLDVIRDALFQRNAS